MAGVAGTAGSVTVMSQIPNSKRTLTDRDSQLRARAALPLGWREEEIELDQTQYERFGGTGKIFEGKAPGTSLKVMTYQQYKLPPDTTVENRTCFVFEPQYKNGAAKLTQPPVNVACQQRPGARVPFLRGG